MGFSRGQFKNSEQYSNSAISIPIFVGLKTKEINRIVKILKSIIDF